MKRLINRFKYYFTTDIMELDITLFDIFIIVLSVWWAIIFTMFVPASLIASLFK